MQSRTFTMYHTFVIFFSLLLLTYHAEGITNNNNNNNNNRNNNAPTFKIRLVRDEFLRYSTVDTFIFQAADYWLIG